LDFCLAQVLGSTISYLASISNPGSVNGKNAGLILISTSFLSIAERNVVIILLKFAMEIFLSI
jgi:hypothetical protein